MASSHGNFHNLERFGLGPRESVVSSSYQYPVFDNAVLFHGQLGNRNVAALGFG